MQNFDVSSEVYRSVYVTIKLEEKGFKLYEAGESTESPYTSTA